LHKIAVIHGQQTSSVTVISYKKRKLSCNYDINKIFFFGQKINKIFTTGKLQKILMQPLAETSKTTEMPRDKHVNGILQDTQFKPIKIPFLTQKQRTHLENPSMPLNTQQRDNFTNSEDKKPEPLRRISQHK